MKNTQSFQSLQISRRLRLLMLPVLVIGALSGTLRPASLHAAESSQSSHQSSYSQQELDRMLAPIALYPDTLLSQILMASTYPLEVVEASRWSRGNSLLSLVTRRRSGMEVPHPAGMMAQRPGVNDAPDHTSGRPGNPLLVKSLRYTADPDPIRP